MSNLVKYIPRNVKQLYNTPRVHHAIGHKKCDYVTIVMESCNITLEFFLFLTNGTKIVFQNTLIQN